MSPITSTPASRAISTLQCGAGSVNGTPGVSTSAAKFAHDTVRRSAVVNPAFAASASLSTPSSPVITSAPPAFSAWQLASPEPPRPNTATVLPAKDVIGIMGASPSFRGDAPASNPESRDSPMRTAHLRSGAYALSRNDEFGNIDATSSSQFQRRKPGQRQHDRDDPEPDHDLRFGPAELLEMMMDRRHLENALSGQLEGGDLHDHRHRLQHEQSADHRKHDLVLDRDRDRAEHAAKRERAGIAHEDRGRRRIEPQKSKPSAEQRPAQHGELAGAGDVVDLQIIGEHGIADQIGDQAEACGCDHDRHDRKPVEAVGQVDRVAGADNDEGAEDHEEPAEIEHHF